MRNRFPLFYISDKNKNLEEKQEYVQHFSSQTNLLYYLNSQKSTMDILVYPKREEK